MDHSELKHLVRLDGSCGALINAAKNAPMFGNMEVPDDCVTVRVKDIIRALRLYLAEELSVCQLRDWASVLELSEGVQYEDGSDTEIGLALFRLSTPEINEPVSFALAKQMIMEIET